MVRTSMVICAAAFLMSCSAVTDFDMPPDLQLYSLNENLPGSVDVTLGADGTGSLTLAPLATPLPDAEDAALLGLLGDGTFDISVQNNDTGVSFNLTDGTRVDAAPTAAGQYYITLDASRTSLTIQFYNETTTGSSLQSGGQYTASFDVIANDYFATETFNRVATVL